MRIGLGVINFLPTRFVVFRTDRKANAVMKRGDSKGSPLIVALFFNYSQRINLGIL